MAGEWWKMVLYVVGEKRRFPAGMTNKRCGRFGSGRHWGDADTLRDDKKKTRQEQAQTYLEDDKHEGPGLLRGLAFVFAA